MQRSKNHAQELSENITLSVVTNSKCMLTPINLLLVMFSHRGMHANPGIDERGSTYIYLGGLGACCAMRELLVQSEALMQG